MDLLPFLAHNWALVLIAVVSGTLLLAPGIMAGAADAEPLDRESHRLHQFRRLSLLRAQQDDGLAATESHRGHRSLIGHSTR